MLSLLPVKLPITPACAIFHAIISYPSELVIRSGALLKYNTTAEKDDPSAPPISVEMAKCYHGL